MKLTAKTLRIIIKVGRREQHQRLFRLSIIFLLSNFKFSKITMTKTQSWIHLFPIFNLLISKNISKTAKTSQKQQKQSSIQNNHLFKTIAKITDSMLQDTSTREEKEVRDKEERGWLQKSTRMIRNCKNKEIQNNLPKEPRRLMYRQPQSHLLVALQLRGPSFQLILQLSNLLQVQQFPWCKLCLNLSNILLWST